MPSGPAEGWPEQSITRSAPKGADQRAHGLDARFRRLVVLERDGGLGAEAPAQREPRILGRPDDDDAPSPHLLGGGHGQNADRPRTLDDDGVAHAEEPGALGAVEGADARGERLGEGAENERHVVGQLVDLRPRQLAEVHVDHLRPAAPEVRRLLEAEVTAIVHGGQALVGRLRVVHAVVAAPAGHQRRQHDLGPHLEGLAHEVLGQLRSDLLHDSHQLVAEGERPGEGPGPVALEDVEVGAADPAGRDADEPSLGRHLGLGHLAYHGRLAGTFEGGDADGLHRSSSCKRKRISERRFSDVRGVKREPSVTRALRPHAPRRPGNGRAEPPIRRRFL